MRRKLPDPKPFTFGSVCSGIEAASVAWGPLGWQAKFFSEIDPFCKQLLKHYYPEVPNLGSLTALRHRAPLLRYAQGCSIDLLAGGTPCQDFSVAGKRGGILDTRGNLSLEFVALASLLKPRWVFWENVPGVLSSWSDVSTPTVGPSEGWQQSDFDLFLSALEECGYGVAYRVLDAQYAGLAQRRERVFVVGYLGDWICAAAVLADEESVRGDIAPRRQTGQGTTDVVDAGVGKCDWPAEISPPLNTTWGDRSAGSQAQEFDSERGGRSVPASVSMCLNGHGSNSRRMDAESETLVTAPLTRNRYADHESQETKLVVAHTLKAEGADTSEDGTGRGVPLTVAASTIVAGIHKGAGNNDGKKGSPQNLILQSVLPTRQNGSGNPSGHNARSGDTKDQYIVPMVTGTLCGSGAGSERPAGQANETDMIVQSQMGVRRLTVVECARLMGFPDTYTFFPRKPRRIPFEDARYYASHGLHVWQSSGHYWTDVPCDGPMYKALWNSWAVPEVRYLGSRIAHIDKLVNG